MNAMPKDCYMAFVIRLTTTTHILHKHNDISISMRSETADNDMYSVYL